MKRKYLVLLLLLLPWLVHAEAKPVITVLDFKSSGVSQREMRSIISLISTTLFKTGKYTVIDVAERETLLKEIEFSAGDCVDESCQLEIGRQLSAEMIVVGSIDKVGSKIVLAAKILETATSKTLNATDGIYQSLDDVLDNIYGFGRELAAASLRAQPAAVETTKDYGQIRVTVKSAAQIFLDGVEQGAFTAGQSGTLQGIEVGSRTVEARYPDGTSERMIVIVRKDKSTEVVFQEAKLAQKLKAEGRRFSDNGDGTMTDRVTGLIWEKKPGGGDKGTGYGGYLGWRAAQDYAERLTLAGRYNWRLPTIGELKALPKDAKGNLARWLTEQGFLEVKDHLYWTATKRLVWSASAFHFQGGIIQELDLYNASCYVWAVCDGPKPLP
jgi:TolB-like protein